MDHAWFKRPATVASDQARPALASVCWLANSIRLPNAQPGGNTGFMLATAGPVGPRHLLLDYVRNDNGLTSRHCPDGRPRRALSGAAEIVSNREPIDVSGFAD